MSLKEFDYKQFLLEKGERVGLGVAVTLMVLMLILSLFMPGKGLFSDSPKEKAKILADGTQQLDTSLRTKQPGPNDLPGSREGRLIDIDTAYLKPDSYATPSRFFEPRMRENPARRPPKIYNIEEGIVAIAHVPVDTYLFSPDFKKIWVLTDKEGRRSNAGSGGNSNFNPFTPLSRGGTGGGSAGMMGMRGGGPGGMMGNPMMSQTQRQFSIQASNVQNLAGQDSEYKPMLIPIENWNQNELTAHQLRPCRMAIIAGSFPYKQQLEEHKTKLRLANTDAVLNETVETNDGKKEQGFRFIGIDVQRKEIDATGKTISDWTPLRLAETYQVWLKNTWVPFQAEDPKLSQVRFTGLAMPLLREFHASQVNSPGIPGMNQLMGMMQRQMPPGAAPPTKTGVEEAQATEKSKYYPDVVEKLPRVKDTLAKLNDTQPQQIAAPKVTTPRMLDVFNPEAVVTTENPQPTNTQDNKQGGANASGEYIPEHVLARAVDVEIQPGKFYRYRLRIRMANPNYKRSDVASPDYKESEFLESKDWYEIPQTVSVPPELNYYVVDEKQGKNRLELRQIPMESAQAELWRSDPRPDQLVMQFQRWVESTQRSRRDSDLVTVGEWAVADRVPVGRGEYIGRKVKVDLPIWNYTRNAFFLPFEDEKAKTRGRVKTGIDVDFGQENPDQNLILIDFEGGKVSASTAKVVDTSAIEVLMLSPDGKLLARNNLKDTKDKDRIDIREEVMKRILEVRSGKKN